MQIPPASSASQAASITSQATSKDKGSSPTANTSSAGTNTPSIELGKTEQSNPDRDAQGQGDGLRDPEEHPRDELDLGSEEGAENREKSAVETPTAPSDGPLDHLDLLG